MIFKLWTPKCSFKGFLLHKIHKRLLKMLQKPHKVATVSLVEYMRVEVEYEKALKDTTYLNRDHNP